jgi:serine O-acetyltransferase
MERISKYLISDLSEDQLIDNLFRRIESFFDLDEKEKDILKSCHPTVLKRIELCFTKVNNKYYRKNDDLLFSYLHSGQYLSYLYFFANELYIDNNDLSSKLYYLNKILHGVDIL